MTTTLSIKFDSDSNSVTADGPIDDTMTCFGLLGMGILIIIKRYMDKDFPSSKKGS